MAHNPKAKSKPGCGTCLAKRCQKAIQSLHFLFARKLLSIQTSKRSSKRRSLGIRRLLLSRFLRLARVAIWEETKKGGRACRRDKAKKIIWVSPGLVFPIVGAMSEFVEEASSGKWEISKPDIFKPGEMDREGGRSVPCSR